MALPQWQQALSDLIFVSCSPNAISKLQTLKREVKVNISLQCQQQRILNRVVAWDMTYFSFGLLAAENGGKGSFTEVLWFIPLPPSSSHPERRVVFWSL